MKNVLLSIGTNQGELFDNLQEAIALIGKYIGNVTARAPFFETEPWGFESPNNFLNTVVCTETELDKHQLLETTQQIERELGRKTKTTTEYQDRIIDIDIIDYDGEIYHDELLTLPHAHVHERKFVLLPLCNINEDWVHPIFNKTARQLLDECTDNTNILSIIMVD